MLLPISAVQKHTTAFAQVFDNFKRAGKKRFFFLGMKVNWAQMYIV